MTCGGGREEGSDGDKKLITKMHKLLSRAMAKDVVVLDLIDNCT